MAIQGLRNTGNFVANARGENWREGILLLYPNGKSPFLALSSMLKTRVVDDPHYHWFEKEVQSRRMALSADITLAGTAISVGSGALGLKLGDIIRVENTTELMLVTADPVADTGFSAQRGFAGTTAATVDYDGNGVNPNLMVIGSVYEEGSLAPTGVRFDPTERSNYTQTFRDTLEATRRGMKTRLRTGDDVKEAKRECLEIHSMGIERAMIFGVQSTGTKNGQPFTTMDGILKQVATANVVDVNAAYGSGLTMTGLEEYMMNIFKYGSSEKMAFCGNRAALTIQQILRKNGTWQFQSGITEYGMNVSRLTSPFGELVLKTHPQFNQITGGTTGNADYYGLDSWLVVLDMDNVRYVTFKDGDTDYQADLTPKGMDGLKSGYITDCSIQLDHPKAHYVMKNVRAAAAG